MSLTRRDIRESRPSDAARSVAEIRSLLTRFAADQQAVGDELASLNPPNNAEAANAELVRGLHDSASALRPIVAKLRSVSSPKAALALANRISPQSGRRSTPPQ